MRASRALQGLSLSVILAAGTVAMTAIPTFAADVITVNSTANTADADVDDNVCDVDLDTPGLQCTLRAAIQTANADPDKNVIKFGFGGSAAKVIRVPNALPRIQHPVIIDGYSAPNTSLNTRRVGTNAKLRIVLKGPRSGGFHGLDVAAPSTIRGLVVQSFGDGIFVGPGGEGSTVTGNFVGTTARGLGKVPNRRSGIHVDCEASVSIGGAAKATRNLVGANWNAGILLCEDVAGTTILGNLVGVGADGKSDLGNGGAGIYAYGTEDLLIGGDAKLAQNVIAYNGWGGVVLTRAEDGSIARGVRILGNSFFRNDGPAIDLDGDGVTPNDGALDADGGSNHRQNYPVIKSVKNVGAKTVVSGVMPTYASSTIQIRLFVDVYKEREGKKFLKTITVTTNGAGKAKWSTKIPKQAVGKRITATATNITRTPAETSEFAFSKKVK